MTAKTCTVRHATTGICGKPAVYAEGEFAECAEHAAMSGSMASTASMVGVRYGERQVGDIVEVHRYGKVYRATVVEVGARGAVYAEFTYGKGTKRRVRV